MFRDIRCLALALTPFLAILPAMAEDAGSGAGALASADPDVVEFDEHITVLASPFMEGRLPGTAGMERAKDYMEMYLVAAGLQPAFGAEESAERGYRQAFELGGQTELIDQHLSLSVDGETLVFSRGSDYEMTGYGASGDVSGEAVFVGYSIESRANEYSSYGEDDDLTGRVAIMFRFEPMNEDGTSQWSSNRPWSRAAGFNGKLRAVAQRHPAAVIVVNTIGAADDRIKQLSSRGSKIVDDCPVFMMSVDAGAKLLEAGDPEGRTAMELRRHADGGGGIVDMDGINITLRGTSKRTPVLAENVGGLLPGRGNLADELIVIGAHLDHLGQGEFGSREGPGKLHPGADDNASGSAAIIMLAKRLAADYAEMDDDANARSILFMGFSAEESGLNGSRYYVDNPIRPLEDHALMINFDMIGRITNNTMSISGIGTADGLESFLEPIAEASDLDVVLSERSIGASDHSSFYRKEIPILFGAIAGLHDDYHTSRDTSAKINRVSAAATVRLFRNILLATATNADRFEFKSGAMGGRGGGAASSLGLVAKLKVRMGIRPEQATAGLTGVMLGDVTADGPAAKAGLEAGDLITKLDKEAVADGQALLKRLTTYEPGDELHVTAIRDGVEVVFMVKLIAR